MWSLRSGAGLSARSAGAAVSGPERLYRTLGTYLIFSAIVEARAPAFISRTRDIVELAPRYRPFIAPVKAVTGAGLLSVRRFPASARLSAATLTVLFVAAVAAHVRVRDISGAMCAAGVNAVVFAAAAIIGPAITGPAGARR